MGDVVDLEGRKVRSTAEELLPILRDRGALLVTADEVGDLGQWRKAARMAGRMLGARVRTGVSEDGTRAWAASLDHQATEADHRRAGLTMEALLGHRRGVDS